MIRSVLTVCTGNICRSPLAEAYLRQTCPDLRVSSAGLHAVVGHDVDTQSAEAAAHHNITLAPHSARQFTTDIGRENDLILVLDSGHRREIANQWSPMLGKTFLLGHFSNGAEVPDPYRLPMGHHLRAAELIVEYCDMWITQIEAMNT